MSEFRPLNLGCAVSLNQAVAGKAEEFKLYNTVFGKLFRKLTAKAGVKSLLGTGMVLFLMSGTAFAQTQVAFKADFDTTGHFINVRMDVRGIDSEQIALKLPVWAPGYYDILNFPKDVIDFEVFDASEDKDHGTSALEWRKEGKSAWVVDTKGVNRLQAVYRVFCSAERTLTTSNVSGDGAFVAPVSVFMYVDGKKDLSPTLELSIPEGWNSISTGMETAWSRNGAPAVLKAEDFDRFYDCPMMIGNHKTVHFELDGYNYVIASETTEGLEDSELVPDLKRIIAATSELMGDIPYNDYAFLWLQGEPESGLEHFNSQVCLVGKAFRYASREAYLGYLSFLAHEYYHLYNVKTIRPIELGPFDYDREVFAPLLWMSEGITVYYEYQILRRAGITRGKESMAQYSEHIQATELNDGRKHMSLRQSAYDTWLNPIFIGSKDKDLRITYYHKGPVLGLLMDIEIRRMTGNEKSMDDVMRLLYNRYYKGLGRGFSEEEYWQTCAEVAGGELDLMRHYVDTTDEIDYERCLAPAGLALDRETLQLVPLDNISKEQRAIREGIFGE